MGSRQAITGAAVSWWPCSMVAGPVTGAADTGWWPGPVCRSRAR